eukprot:s43_g52.t1
MFRLIPGFRQSQLRQLGHQRGSHPVDRVLPGLEGLVEQQDQPFRRLLHIFIHQPPDGLAHSYPKFQVSPGIWAAWHLWRLRARLHRRRRRRGAPRRAVQPWRRRRCHEGAQGAQGQERQQRGAAR